MIDQPGFEAVADARMIEADRQAAIERLRRSDRGPLRTRVARRLADAATRLDPQVDAPGHRAQRLDDAA
jgi:hypothetical protein